MTEDDIEQQAIAWLQDAGWDFRRGPDIAPDSDTPARADWRQVVLRQELADTLDRLNPGMPPSALDEAAHAVTQPDHPSLIQRNRAVHKALVDGIAVDVTDAQGIQRGDRLRLIDFEQPERNRFLVVNQFTVQGSKQPRRPDLVCFINGLPIAVLELKNAASEQAGIWSAYNQLQTYKDDIPDLFISNAALVISDGLQARIGSLTADRERFMPWRTVGSEHDRPLLQFELETVIRGFFKPALLLDYLRYFVLFEQADGQLIKKIAGYHQFHAVREAVRATVIAATPLPDHAAQEARASYGQRVQPGSRKGGIVWHTQGSGKSISMLCFAAKLMREPALGNPTLVIVTDRNDLDGQLFQTFIGARSLLKELPQQANDRDELRTLLAGRPSGGIIFSTVQKFAPAAGESQFPMLTDRSNVVVIADEAHHSQYGFNAVLDKKTGRYLYGFAKHLRDALPKATFVGFTGTPVESTDKDTRAVFGDYVSIYDIQDAVDDGATVPIYYESRLAKLSINQADIEQLNADVEEVFEDEEDVAQREAGKSRWAQLEKLVGAEPRLRQVAADLVTHFEARNAAVLGKGMVVCMSRAICAALYAEIKALRPGWHSDDPALGANVDKPMRDHNLMQAIARVNRVFRDKQGGLVVDYIGIAAELRNALKTYTDSRGKGQPALDTAEALAKLKELMDVARGQLHGFDFSNFRTRAVQLLIPAANHVLAQDEGKKRWADVVLPITQVFSLCGTLDDAITLREEIAFFQAVKAVIAKATESDKKLDEDRRNAVLRQILDNAVVAEGVEDIFKLAGLVRPDIGILSDAFLDEVRQLPQKNFAVELLQKLLNDEVKSRSRTNVVLERKFGDRLLAALNRYRSRAVESAQVIEELIAMAKEFREAVKRGDILGLNESELAFYDALSNNESAVRQLGDPVLKAIAQELTQKLRSSATVDWQKRESVRARLRNLVRITLRRHKYPPDLQDEAIQLVMNQAERLADDWTQ